MPTDKEKLLRLCADATPGPWGWEQYGEKSNNYVVGAYHPPATGFVREYYDEETGSFEPPEDYPVLVDSVVFAEDNANYSDAAFISAARTALPEYIQKVEELEQENYNLGVLVHEGQETIEKLEAELAKHRTAFASGTAIMKEQEAELAKLRNFALALAFWAVQQDEVVRVSVKAFIEQHLDLEESGGR